MSVLVCVKVYVHLSVSVDCLLFCHFPTPLRLLTIPVIVYCETLTIVHCLCVSVALRVCARPPLLSTISYKAVVKFLKNNHLLCVIRAHEAQDEGLVACPLKWVLSGDITSIGLCSCVCFCICGCICVHV